MSYDIIKKHLAQLSYLGIKKSLVLNKRVLEFLLTLFIKNKKY